MASTSDCQCGHVSWLHSARHPSGTYPCRSFGCGCRDYEPAFEHYRLPDGTVVPVDATASKGAPTIGFTLKGGEIVTAARVASGDR